jgi:hypothetical protein
MCFSAGASFVGGVVISAVGVATGIKVQKPTQRLFAVIPLLFGLQQLAEGVLWVTVRSNGHDRLQDATAYIFLITALVIWPVMVPLSMWLMEEVAKRKKILFGLMATGGVLSLFYAFCLISYDVTPQINSFHIEYINEFPGNLMQIAFLLYLTSTIAPLFISSIRRMWLFGVMITLSCLVSGIFFTQYLTSVWCFFAALISMVIYWILGDSRSKAGLLTIGGLEAETR